MSINIKSFIVGPAWAEVSIPAWFKERAEALVAQLGHDSPDVQLFKEILAAGHVEQSTIVRADELAGATKNSDILLLAIDIATHGFTVLQAMGQVLPLRRTSA